MIELYLARNEQTGRALYADEYKYLGRFANIAEAVKRLGECVVNACSIKTVK